MQYIFTAKPPNPPQSTQGIFCFVKMRARLYTFARVNFFPVLNTHISRNLFWATKHLQQFPGIHLLPCKMLNIGNSFFEVRQHKNTPQSLSFVKLHLKQYAYLRVFWGKKGTKRVDPFFCLAVSSRKYATNYDVKRGFRHRSIRGHASKKYSHNVAKACISENTGAPCCWGPSFLRQRTRNIN